MILVILVRGRGSVANQQTSMCLEKTLGESSISVVITPNSNAFSPIDSCLWHPAQQRWVLPEFLLLKSVHVFAFCDALSWFVSHHSSRAGLHFFCSLPYCNHNSGFPPASVSGSLHLLCICFFGGHSHIFGFNFNLADCFHALDLTLYPASLREERA